MKPADIDRVFGRDRLKMMTGEHVEVFREDALPGERRRYTKRFLSTAEGDFRHWTEREWRILARLVGHRIGPVPDVVQFDRGSADRPAIVQTYDAGITVDHWATLLPVERDGCTLRHVFEDCAHWWALAQHCLVALDAIHELHLVHLDLKADNVCIPLGPLDFDPYASDQTLRPLFGQIALIDFAFSLVSGESLATALPIGHQADYDYQSPRLLRALEAGRQGDLQPTRELDWRCDMFSLAAMLTRYLPPLPVAERNGWNGPRYQQAQVLVNRLFDVHHAPLPAMRPHRQLIVLAQKAASSSDLVSSLERGWMLALDAPISPVDTPTPVTRIAVPVTASVMVAQPAPYAVPRRATVPRWTWAAVAAAGAVGAMGAPLLNEAWQFWWKDDAVVAALPREGTPKQAIETALAAPVLASPATAVPARAANAADAASSQTMAAVDAAASIPAPAETASTTTSVSEPAPPASSPTVASTTALPEAKAARVLAAAKSPAKVATPPKASPSSRARTAAHGAAAKTSRIAAAMARYPYAGLPAAKAAKPVVVASAPSAKPLQARTSASRRSAAPALHPSWPLQAASAPTPSPAPSTSPPAVSLASVLPAPASAAAPDTDDAPSAPRLSDDFSERSDELLADHIPRIAQHAERRVLRVLHIAAQADTTGHTGDILQAARTVRVPTDDTLFSVKIAPGEAKRLNDAASNAFWNERNLRRALSLQARAFGANPLDREVAGNFAFYLLKQRPAQAETARQLAMHALTVSDPQLPSARVDDWATFAIASALAGRQRDATNALFVMLALSKSLDRPCRLALAAYASHGEKLRQPTEAMLYRIHSWGRSEESTFCRWPPSWSISARAQ